MKKITSAALLALKLTWLSALLYPLVAVGLQIFDVFRNLMPGGVPLQVTFGFENLLQSAQRVGRFWMVLLLFALTRAAGDTAGSKSVYTMNRLGLSENRMTLVFGGVFTGYFLLYWALQIAVAYGFFVWYSRFTLVSSNSFMLACWRSEWLHTLLPLNEWWGYLRNLAICTSFGFSAAFGSQLSRRGKFPWMSLIPPVLCLFLLTGRIGDFWLDMILTVVLIVFTIGYFFTLRGGWEDDDL